ncbi:MAG: 16S rRNA (uracil(1498)-N(3))-methyltransferase [Planctomycetes bacterium]|nr:16S rRNA (uracil(1498)-N(3))-methyltransferase [Planctomycetota bacterium]
MVDPRSRVFHGRHGGWPLLFQQAATESARTSSKALIDRIGATKWLALIDPEGGLTDGEIDVALGVGVESVTNAPATLRTETAAVAAFAALAVVRAKLGSAR